MCMNRASDAAAFDWIATASPEDLRKAAAAMQARLLQLGQQDLEKSVDAFLAPCELPAFPISLLLDRSRSMLDDGDENPWDRFGVETSDGNSVVYENFGFTGAARAFYRADFPDAHEVEVAGPPDSIVGSPIDNSQKNVRATKPPLAGFDVINVGGMG